ncbi:hypothetical protein P8452_10762 [Trifolium repens]|nr:hypothetical protein P8452_10762 [Trifolium repens]
MKAFTKALEGNPRITPKQLHQLPELSHRPYHTIKGKLRGYKSKGKMQGKWHKLMEFHVQPALKNTEENIKANHQSLLKEAFSRELESEKLQDVISTALAKALKKERRNEEK